MGNVELLELCERISKSAVQRVPSLLESRHRLLHLRATLESKWSQPRYPSMYIGPSFNSKLCHKEGATSWPSIWEDWRTKRHHISRNLRRDASRKALKGFTIDSRKISNFVNLNSNMIELKKSASRWTRTRRRFHQSNDARWVLSILKRIGGSLSTILERLDRWEIVLTSTMRWPQKQSTPRIWRRTTQANSILEILAMAPIFEFFIQLVAMERFLVELMTIKKKVHEWAYTQSDMMERRDPLFAVFGQNLRRDDLQDFFFVAVRSFTADSSLLQPTGCANTTPHTVHFSQ